MNEIDLNLSKSGVAFNGWLNTVGVIPADAMATNQTRRMRFSAEYLKEWAESVYEATGTDQEVDVVFTPGKPMVAVHPDSHNGVGIGVCPRVSAEEYDDMTGGDES